MSRPIGESVANMAKANIGFQFVRLVSGQITLWQFLKYAILRPLMYFLIVTLGVPALIFVAAEVYYWTQGTSAVYHWVKGDLDSMKRTKSEDSQSKVQQTRDEPKAKQVHEPAVAVKEDATKPMNDFEAELTAKEQASIEDRKPIKQAAEIDGPCVGLVLTTSTGRDECAQRLHREWQKVDRELNDEYKALMASLSTEQRAQLKAKELEWVRNKIRTCRDLNPIDQNHCNIDQTTERLQYLRSYNPDME